MKRTLLAIALFSAAGYAAAQDTLEPVIVDHVDGYWIAENCKPPSSAPECASFHQMIRENFTDREIGMLFGAASAYPEYRTSYSLARERYDRLVRYVEDNGVIPVASVSVGTIDAIPPPAVYEQTTTSYAEPVRNEVVVNDDDAVLVVDDPDAVMLNAASNEDLYPNSPTTTTTTTTRQVVYYDDGTPLLRER